MKMKKILFVALSLLLLLAFGCSHDTNNSSVTNPNAPGATPKGTVQGIIKDSCTNAPIEGAVVDIGVGQATTKADGQYTIYDVPATSYVDQIQIDGNLTGGPQASFVSDGPVSMGGPGITGTIDSGWSGRYTAAINMTNAKIKGVKVTNYADTYYNLMYVKFASLTPPLGMDNVDVTVVDQLGTGGFNFLIGKLTASIGGKVVKTDLINPAWSYNVYLYSNDAGVTGNDATGRYGNQVASTNTAADGTFLITGLEAGRTFDIVVVDTASSAPAFRYKGYSTVSTDCGDLTNYVNIIVKSTDDVCPFIASTSPVMFTDVSGNTGSAGLNVVITFSEAIKATPYNTGNGLTASPFYSSLYDDIDVNYLGNKTKAGNIPHTMTWNADMTQLTINIPTGSIAPMAVYSVVILNNRYLTDASGNLLSDKPNTDGIVTCLNDYAKFSAAFPSTQTQAYIGMMATTFSTYGAIDAHAIKGLTLRNAPLNYNTIPQIDWLADVGSKSYNIYCQMMQWPINKTCTGGPPTCDPLDCVTSGGQLHPYVLVGSTTDTEATLDLTKIWAHVESGDSEFVENWGIKLSYYCYIRGVNGDGIEGPYGAPLYIQDEVAPTAGATGTSNPTSGTLSAYTVCFSEPMNELLVETAANWTFNAAAFSGGVAPTISSINYVPYVSPFCATITLSATSAPLVTHAATTPVTLLTASPAIADVSGNALTAWSDTFTVSTP